MMPSLNVKKVAEENPWVLLVDDEAFNLEILEELLSDCGYQTDTANNGREACDILSANPNKYSVVLLDRMMPEMNGIEVTEFMRKDSELRKIPIVMQSAKAAKQDIEEGLNAGILYYLTKPFAKKDLLSIVETAASYYFDYQRLLVDLPQSNTVQADGVPVEVQTLDDARRVSTQLAGLAQEPDKIVMGLYELIVNGIEHGNLGVGYRLKSCFKEKSAWIQEIERRLQLDENKNKSVKIVCRVNQDKLSFEISDDGMGFNFREFFEVSTLRSMNTVGRGIAIARILCFDKVEYQAPGNIVVVTTQARSGS